MEAFAVLPWQLRRECLLRVPYHSHGNLRTVCKTWETAIKHPEFYEDRKKRGTSEQLICLVELSEFLDDTHPNLQMVISLFDPLRGTRKTLPPLPHFPGCHAGIPLFCDCLCVNQRLFLLGGCNPIPQEERLKTVFIFDLASSKWRRGADMPVSPAFGAYSVSPQGLIYVAGGEDGNENLLRSAAVYNVFEDQWKLLPDISRGRVMSYGAFLDGKFFVIGGDIDEDTAGDPRRCLVVSSSGRLYSFEKQRGVMEYDSDENVWRALGSLPTTLRRISRSVAWREKIFVRGYVDSDVPVCYMYEPPPIRSAAGQQTKRTGMWTAIERSENSYLHNGHKIHRACTFEV
eukprot:PITA_17221